MLRHLYRKLKLDYSQLSNDIRLSLSVNALNNTAGPIVITPTMLLFCMVPRLPLGNMNTIPSTQRERFRALQSARNEMERIVGEKSFKVAMNRKRKSMQIIDLPMGSKVLVDRKLPKYGKDLTTSFPMMVTKQRSWK